MLGFHAVLVAAGLSIEDARTQGWLFAAPLETSPWMPWHTAGFAQTEWHLLLGYASDIGTLVLVTTLTVLINATGLEMETRTDANLDRELVIQGAANIVAPLLGGFLGYLSMNRSMMNFKLGATSVVRQTDCNLLSRARALTTFARMSEARAVQMNGLGSRLWFST